VKQSLEPDVSCFSLDLTSQLLEAPSTEIECLLNDNHQKGKMMIMTSGSQVDSPVAETTRQEGGGRNGSVLNGKKLLSDKKSFVRYKTFS